MELITFLSFLLMNTQCLVKLPLAGLINAVNKQLTGSHDNILGKKSMILIGDLGQLPPAADVPLYHLKPSSDVGE